MNLKCALLGFLSWRPLSGYDLKKLFAEVGFIYWSGNNNQIYRTLLDLVREGLVSSQVDTARRGPLRKVYTITDAGRGALAGWLPTLPQLPELRHPFLVQLAWADALEADVLDGMLAQYEEAIRLQWLMRREQQRRKSVNPARTRREAFLWEQIHEHLTAFSRHELAWVRALRADLKALPPEAARKREK